MPKIEKEAVCENCNLPIYQIKSGIDGYSWVSSLKRKDSWKCGNVLSQ